MPSAVESSAIRRFPSDEQAARSSRGAESLGQTASTDRSNFPGTVVDGTKHYAAVDDKRAGPLTTVDLALLQSLRFCPRRHRRVKWGGRNGRFKGRHFSGEIILWPVQWYCRYGVSYRDLASMLAERGTSVDHSTIYRWVQRYASEMEKRLRCYWKRPAIWRSGRVDQTYIKVKGRWTYLYRAVDKDGDTIDFYLSSTRHAKAAKRFLGKALNGLKVWQQPMTINTDKAPTYGLAITAR